MLNSRLPWIASTNEQNGIWTRVKDFRLSFVTIFKKCQNCLLLLDIFDTSHHLKNQLSIVLPSGTHHLQVFVLFFFFFFKIKDSPTKISLRNKNYLPTHCPTLVITASELHTHFWSSGNSGSIMHLPAPHFKSQSDAPKVKDLFTFLSSMSFIFVWLITLSVHCIECKNGLTTLRMLCGFWINLLLHAWLTDP